MGLGAMGCASVDVQPVAIDREALGLVCVERNPRARIPAVIDAIRDGFRRNRVATEVRYADEVEDCPYVLRYTARREWDLNFLYGGYVAEVGMTLHRGNTEVGRARYRDRGGFFVPTPTKYQRTTQKLKPVLDRLLAQTEGEAAR